MAGDGGGSDGGSDIGGEISTGMGADLSGMDPDVAGMVADDMAMSQAGPSSTENAETAVGIGNDAEMAMAGMNPNSAIDQAIASIGRSIGLTPDPANANLAQTLAAAAIPGYGLASMAMNGLGLNAPSFGGLTAGLGPRDPDGLG